jgi:hypothetical protein
MKKIEKDGIIYYIEDFLADKLHEDSSPLQLLQVASYAISKDDHTLLKHRAYLPDIIENQIEAVYGKSAVAIDLPKKNTDWNTVTEIVTGMVNWTFTLEDNIDLKLELKIAVGKITVSFRRGSAVNYIDVIAPRGSGKTKWLTDFFNNCEFPMLKAFYPDAFKDDIKRQYSCKTPAHIAFIDNGGEVVRHLARNSIVIRTTSNV